MPSILALAYLQKTGMPHESLRSCQILLENEGQVKLADPFCSIGGINYDVLYDNVNTSLVYPSPENCAALEQGCSTPISTINQYKSDVFTLGMILLEIGLLQSQDDCYSQNKRTINWQRIQNNIQRFS